MTIERAARAIAAADQKSPTTLILPEHRRMVRAALEAISEPTPEMVEACLKEMHNIAVYGGPGGARTDAKRLWRVMHAAMMDETK